MKNKRAAASPHTPALPAFSSAERPGQPEQQVCGYERLRRRSTARGGLQVYYIHYNVVVVANPTKTQPFSIRLGAQTNMLVLDEVHRSGRSRSVVVEELVEEAAKARLHPGIAFRGRPRRAWVIGSGLDVWEIVEMLRSYDGNHEHLRASHPLLDERHLRTARTYAERFPEEINSALAENRRPLDELRQLYPFLHTAPDSR
jgi:uncharacterized protein (DUF433 family)